MTGTDYERWQHLRHKASNIRLIDCDFWLARLFKLTAIAFIGQSLAACTSIPKQDLTAYTSAFDQFSVAGNLLLDEISPFVSSVPPEGAEGAETAEIKSCESDGKPYPPCFDPNLVPRSSGLRINEDPSITARRAALEIATRYNALLVALAEGQSVEVINQQFDQLTGLAGAAVGALTAAGVAAGPYGILVPVALELFKDLAARFEQARANDTVRQSLIASESDIKQLFTLMIEDMPAIYDIYREGQQHEIVRLSDVKNRARLSKDDAAKEGAEKDIARKEQQIAAFHESLGAYVRLLRGADQSLDTLVRALQDPQVSAVEVDAFIRDAVEMKVAAGSFLNLVSEVRQPD
jgi:hypothetical protein